MMFFVCYIVIYCWFLGIIDFFLGKINKEYVVIYFLNKGFFFRLVGWLLIYS